MSAMYLISRLRCASTDKYALLRSVAVRALTVDRAKGLGTHASSTFRRTRHFARRQDVNLKPQVPRRTAGDYVLRGAAAIITGWVCYCDFQLLSATEDIRRIVSWPVFVEDSVWPKFVKDWVWPEPEKDDAKSESMNGGVIAKAASLGAAICLPLFLCPGFIMVITPWPFSVGAAVIASICVIGVGCLFRDT